MNKVECGTHGSAPATFICQHLPENKGRGFIVGCDPEDPDDLYPDACCNQCEEVLEKEGQWNNKSEGFAGIKLVCAKCYMQIRQENWIQDDEAFKDLLTDSFEYLQRNHEKFISEFKLNDHELWDWSQETGTLIFTHDETPQVEAEIQFSGTLQKKSQTWMWAWGNKSLEERVKSASRLVRIIGEENNFLKQHAGYWDADEVDGWEMTAILAKHIEAIGAYRTPDKDGFTYIVVTNARWLL